MKKILCGGVVLLGLLLASTNLAIFEKEARAECSATKTVRGESEAPGRYGSHQTLITSDRFLGNPVQGAAGETLGKVSQVVFDSTGQIRYLVVTTPADGKGGVYLVPWTAVKTRPGVISIEVTGKQFKNAPEGLSITSQEREEELHRFYGVAPYWQADQEQRPEKREQTENSPMDQEREHGGRPE